MIYTLTCNPSLDYVVTLDKFQPGAINRSEKEVIYPGGKGINVGLVLNRLGVETEILAFAAGNTGKLLALLLENEHCPYTLLPAQEGFTRINIKIRSGKETAINGQGPVITAAALDKLNQFTQKMHEGDMLVISGTTPRGCSVDLYGSLVQCLESRGISCVVDATGSLLLHALPFHPFLIKPNLEEMEEVLGHTFIGRESIFEGAKQLQEKGARNVLVSLGKNGALLLDERGGRHAHLAPEGKMVNSVGAGDSMVAGFLAGYLPHHDYDEALHLGICAGSATAFTMHLAEKDAILKLAKG